MATATQTTTEAIPLDPIVGKQAELNEKRAASADLPASQSPQDSDAVTPDASSSDNDIKPAVLSKSRATIVIAQLVGLQLFSSFCNGVLVVGLPSVSADLGLDAGLQLWPMSVFYLVAGSCLMLAGSVTDVVGTRPIIMAASVLLVATALAGGFVRTGAELIALRGLQGLSNAMAVPASVSIVSTTIEFGKPRNLGFACLGFSGPMGFLFGLLLGGVFIDTVGWRPAFYFVAAASFVLSALGFWVLPRDPRPLTFNDMGKRLALDIDWVGAVIASTGLAMLSYVMATLSATVENIHKPVNIALLAVGIACLPAFVVWMGYQVKRKRPALIPNSVWRQSSFTSICIMILFTSAVSNSMELFSSLFFQEVQGNNALGASLRILPALVMGITTNIFTGYFVDRMPTMLLVMLSSILSALSPLLMALVQPQWPYWYMSFIAQVVQPLSPDVLFTVGLLIISAVFPQSTQGLGGAVFNTCSQLGTSIGLTIAAVIAESRANASPYSDKHSPEARLVGYRAVFWTLFAWAALVCVIGLVGLRRVGKIGIKQE